MPLWRRIAIAGALVFVVAVAFSAFRPWTSAVSLPAVDNKTAQAKFTCGAPLGSDGVEPANDLARSGVALPHQPCTTRTARRVLALADFAVGGAALVALLATRSKQQDVLKEQ